MNDKSDSPKPAWRFDSFDELYDAINSDSPAKEYALLLVELSNWFFTIAEFDTVTGYPDPRSLTDLLKAIAERGFESAYKEDRLTRIIRHCSEALHELLRNPREKLQREYRILPIHVAREIDSESIRWLNRKTGRNIREKLAGQPHIKAIKRFFSISSIENSLLKAFVMRLSELLEKRPGELTNKDDQLLSEEMISWLRSDAVQDIPPWQNFPPNNTLLQDRLYKKIWDSWLWFQNLDQNIKLDCKMFFESFRTVVFWTILAKLNQFPQVRLLQQPCPFGSYKFRIKPMEPVEGWCLSDTSIGEINLSNPTIGEIISFKIDKKYGSIKLLEVTGENVFFSLSEVKFDLGLLKMGLEVSFKIGKSKKGPIARNIELFSAAERGFLKIRAGANQAGLAEENILISIGQKQLDINFFSPNIRVMMGAKQQAFNYSFRSVDEITSTACEYLLGMKIPPAKNMPQPETHSENVVIDLYGSRPVFSRDRKRSAKLPFRLMRQFWPHKEYSQIPIDCGTAKAMAIASSDVSTISMRDVFLRKEAPEILSGSADKFCESLKKYFDPACLTYIIPDDFDDFTLDIIRKSINFNFREAAPLPRSIAAVFAWQASAGFKESGISDGDLIFVLDYHDSVICCTPVRAKFNEELGKKIPEGKGFYWERYPTYEISTKLSESIIEKVAEQIPKNIAEEMMRLFDINGLLSEIGMLSLKGGGSEWYHVSGDFRRIALAESKANTIPCAKLEEIKKSFQGYQGNRAAYLLPISDSIQIPSEAKFRRLPKTVNSTMGGHILAEWQEKAGNTALWKDNLPELKMKIPVNGCYEDFYLVKDKTVTANRGAKIPLEIAESFTLPRGEKQYEFEIFRGAGENQFLFLAVLKFDFALTKEVICRLKMTYTYGADEPYELVFIPENQQESGFREVKVEWREKVPADDSKLPIPSFPRKLSWDELRSLPNKSGGTDDIVNWIEINLDSVLKAKDENERKKILYRLRFAVLTFWNHGRSLKDDDVLDAFRLSIRSKIELLEKMRVSELINPIEKDRLLKFLASLNEDAPAELTIILLSYSRNTKQLQKYLKPIAYAIGSYELEWQQELFAQVISKEKFEGFLNIGELLSIVFWRSEDLVFKLDEEQLITFRDKVYALFKGPFETKLNEQRISNDNITKHLELLFAQDLYQFQNLLMKITKILELLLALLRTRKSDDASIRKIFSPNEKIIQSIITQLDALTKFVIDHKVAVTSRINLDVKKAEGFEKTPDLLYALRLYLTGNDGANTIHIKGVSE